jgi:hypothetical protein
MVLEMPSYQWIMADQTVTLQELKEQTLTVVSLFRILDKKLDSEEKELVNQAVCELAVLFELYSKKLEGNENGDL